ncbi:MAG: sigma-70 family RNA polymerase sigma factor [Phycisphaeraceae bacterium]|nr:sigma-70 family RNA polymerase sigma factor [Phycisphaeraceae bacterium]MCW5763631.1 sigma-70 family RNA polymerase sigma factor [Phycisphaeraceae bacterium]
MGSVSMTADDHGAFLAGEYVHQRVRFQVSRLARKFNLDESAKDDAAQDLHCGLCRAMGKFNPELASAETFASRVVELEARHIARRLRRSRHHHSLVDDADVVERATQVADAVATRLDLDEALSVLPLDLRRVAERLKHQSVAELAVNLKIHRSTVYRKIAQIRHILLESGLDDAL